MILPTTDIIAVQKARAYRFGYSGLVVVVRGHEELFFEFSSRERRNEILHQLEVQLETARAEMLASRHQSKEQRDAEALKELESSTQSQPFSDRPDDMSPIMFSSSSSSFVTFDAPKSLHSESGLLFSAARLTTTKTMLPSPPAVTCLTVGSRGDVQPYIALCLELIKDGHRCRIASHPEYRDWVEGHGIEFSPVGGDPAELMR